MDDEDDEFEFKDEEAPEAGLHSYRDLDSINISGGNLGTVFEGESLKQIARYTKTIPEKVMDKIRKFSKKLPSYVSNIINTEDFKNAIDRIPNLQYKSPKGLLLGYLAQNYIKSDERDDQENLNEIFTYGELDSATDSEKLIPANIIAYARLWNSLE